MTRDRQWYRAPLRRSRSGKPVMRLRRTPQTTGQLTTQRESRFAGETRRRVLALMTGTAASFLSPPSLARPMPAEERSLTFCNLHTGETLNTVYWAAGHYLTDSLRHIDRILRDHRTGDVYPIDPRLLDAIHALRKKLRTRRSLDVISGYRSPKTNEMLHRQSTAVAKRSLHTQGKAIDLRVPGCDLADVWRAALSMHAGGVGYYPRSNFIHFDIGRVRSWTQST